ncbi:GNAT family N-acetyltransferase [Gryllotalpicola reticulitermitis]|uniref:GNAT family N-acetyltransferase n=1 Tax=Gryllotalpicola reticulitermitis TaxID=1184153 RepID=A0ABV8Q811_9MICO
MTQHINDDVAMTGGGAPVPPASDAPASSSALDNPVWYSLRSAHRSLARGDERALRYPADVSPFMAVADDHRGEDWERLAELVGTDPVVLVNPPADVPASWVRVRRLDGLQMISPENPSDATPGASATAITVLGESDRAEMLELATITKPGPFALRTGLLGRYVGIREEGRLIAMAGERLQPDGWAEISAVCTLPEFRGRGLARLVMDEISAGIRARGDRPFLHVVATNIGAIRLYERMGFSVRRPVQIDAYETR